MTVTSEAVKVVPTDSLNTTLKTTESVLVGLPVVWEIVTVGLVPSPVKVAVLALPLTVLPAVSAGPLVLTVTV